jgi:hypothetical protein
LKTSLSLAAAFLVLAVTQIKLEHQKSQGHSGGEAERYETRYKIERGTIFYLAERGEWIQYDQLPEIEGFAEVHFPQD